VTGPIGIFDSGLGGLTVAGEVLRRLPDESIIYFADTAHVPYGERPLAEIRGFALGITDFLVRRGAKAVVMACNMSSAVALEPAREIHPRIPILGVIEPGSRAAVAAGNRRVAVLATTGTAASGAYGRAIRRLDPAAEVYEQACPPFVPLVEAGLVDTEDAEIAVRSCLEPALSAGAGTVVLGCTHYPFLRHVIARAAPLVRIIDPAEETVSDLQNMLSQWDLLASPGDPVQHAFFASGEADGFIRLGGGFLGRGIDAVQPARWEVDLVPQQCEVGSEK